MNYQPQKQQIAFVLPVHFWKAEIIFQRVSESFARVTVPIKPTQASRHIVSTDALSKGRWQVFLSWVEGGNQYCREDTIDV